MIRLRGYWYGGVRLFFMSIFSLIRISFGWFLLIELLKGIEIFRRSFFLKMLD